ncbi:mRNA decay activator protein ZFP36L3 [Galendromus occidentalis]|uniref:mRNA decay activator protein ZFP36L3 n=1 Tax=Galendromus occidentalis TaxID=34638 RepID=A0AAJ6VXN1_9ACAR|nr:mRNA decay activator protein ZFP36L3 [Galendromus occidentalis]
MGKKSLRSEGTHVFPSGIRAVISKGRTRAHLTAEQKRKTELCRNISESGSCQYAERCLYAHSPDELRQRPVNAKFRTDLCKAFHEEGFCGYGARCSFRHEVPKKQKDMIEDSTKTLEELYRVLPRLWRWRNASSSRSRISTFASKQFSEPLNSTMDIMEQ